MSTITKRNGIEFMIILVSHYKITDFQSYAIILKDWEQWKKIISSHYITYLGFKYEKWPHEKKCINSAFYKSRNFKNLICSTVIDWLY